MSPHHAVTIAAQLIRACGAEAVSARVLARNLGCKPRELRARTGLTFGEIMTTAAKRVGRSARFKPAHRRAQILHAAVVLARRVGYQALTRGAVADAAQVSTGLVGRYYSIEALRAAVVEYAVAQGLHRITAEAVIARSPYVAGLTKAERQKALTAAANQ